MYNVFKFCFKFWVKVSTDIFKYFFLDRFKTTGLGISCKLFPSDKTICMKG